MAGPFEQLGAEFANFATAVAGSGSPLVTVAQVNPHTGAVLATSANVTSLPLPNTGKSYPARGGEVGVGEGQFWLRASEVSFVPKKRDRITDAAGVVWNIDECETVGYGATGTLYRCPATKARA